ncbi:MAG: hypothetical protein OSA48_02690 [Akkermansiaceae bacterium]|nr:hypothetical protein [Akkermansiaceae bacterium]
MSGAIYLPLLAALLHPILGWAIQSATKRGVSLLLIAGICNIVTGIVVLTWKRPPGPLTQLSPHDWIALANGFLFFFGQWFSILSLRNGHLAVHSSALGAKILIVALLSIGFGLEPARPFLLLAVVVAIFAVFLVAGASLAGWRAHRRTVGLTLIACLFFGTNDYLTGQFGGTVGTARWLGLMLGTSATLSLFLVASRAKQFADLTRNRGAFSFVLLAGLMLGIQTVLVNIAFSEYAQPTLSNVAYASRGVIAVIALAIFGAAAGKEYWGRRITGSFLMIAALWLALM